MQGGGLTQAIGEILSIFGITLPPWAAPAFMLCVAILLLPWILRNMRTSRARKLLKRSIMESAEVRQSMEERALTIVDGNAPGLLAVAEESVRRGRFELAKKALTRIPDNKLKRQRWQLMLEMQPRDPATPDAAVLVIQRLLEAEMVKEARERTERFLRRWPNDTELQAVQKQLDR